MDITIATKIELVDLFASHTLRINDLKLELKRLERELKQIDNQFSKLK